MKSLFEALQNKDIKELTKHPRHKMMDEFLEKINQQRNGTKYEKYTMKRLGMITAHLSLMDMHYLLKRCNEAGNFSKCFFGSLKIK